ncbi:YjfB family protein [Erwinia amylovora]
MDVSQITSLATGLDNMELSTKVSNILLKKSLDNQASMASGMINSIPQLPANPSIGRNINTTA